MADMFRKIKTGYSVYLRALALEDANTTHKWRQDDDVTKSLVGRKYFVSPDYEKKWINDVIFSSDSNIKLAVCLNETHQHIGNVYLDNVDFFNQNAMLSLMIGEKALWGKGVGTEASMLMLHYAFYEMNLKRVYSYQLIDNIGSIRVHEKCGFQQEGILRKAVFKNGKLVDLNLMGILREDFDKKVMEIIE